MVVAPGSYLSVSTIVDTWPSPSVTASLNGGWFGVDGNLAGTIVRATSKFQINTTDGITGSFLTADGKTVTVTGGIITAIT